MKKKNSLRNKQLLWFLVLLGALSTSGANQQLAEIIDPASALILLKLGHLMAWIAILMIVVYGVAIGREIKEHQTNDRDETLAEANEGPINKKTNFLTKELRLSDLFSLNVKLSTQSRHIVIVSTLLILISGAGVYWFAYRPYVIKKECSEQVNKRYEGDSYIEFEEAALYETYFKVCTNRKGL